MTIESSNPSKSFNPFSPKHLRQRCAVVLRSSRPYQLFFHSCCGPSVSELRNVAPGRP